MSTPIIVESGMQLLARLKKKASIENYYPLLFETGPKESEVIELFSKGDMSYFLTDLICEILTIETNDGEEPSVLILNTDGNLDFDTLINYISNKKITLAAQAGSLKKTDLLNRFLNKLYALEVQDVLQFYTSLYNLENILTEHPNISLIIINTLTAFYWVEQENKITKMDLYIKNILRKIQKITNEYKVNILYTRPDYFSSSKDNIENLEACCEHPTLERINYRIELKENENCTYIVNIKSFNKQLKRMFQIERNQIKWM